MPFWKNISLACFATLGSVFAGELAHISDPDGFVNIRVAPVRGADVFQTAKQGECVELFRRSGDWTHVAYLSGQEMVTGYIKSSRLIQDSRCKVPTVEAKLGQCAVASILAEELTGFDDLQQWHDRFRACNPPELNAQISDYITSLLAKQWSQALPELADKQSDPAFIQYVTARILAAPSTQDLLEITSSTHSCDALSAKSFCNIVKAAAVKALKPQN